MSETVWRQEKAQAAERQIRTQQQAIYQANDGEGSVINFLQAGTDDETFELLTPTQKELWLSLNTLSFGIPLTSKPEKV